MRLVFPPLLPLELSACGKNPGCSGAPDSMFFDLGMSPDVRNAAVDACRDALDAQTDGAVEVVGSDFSQANSAVYMYVGAKGAPRAASSPMTSAAPNSFQWAAKGPPKRARHRNELPR